MRNRKVVRQIIIHNFSNKISKACFVDTWILFFFFFTLEYKKNIKVWREIHRYYFIAGCLCRILLLNTIPNSFTPKEQSLSGLLWKPTLICGPYSWKTKGQTHAWKNQQNERLLASCIGVRPGELLLCWAWLPQQRLFQKDTCDCHQWIKWRERVRGWT